MHQLRLRGTQACSANQQTPVDRWSAVSLFITSLVCVHFAHHDECLDMKIVDESCRSVDQSRVPDALVQQKACTGSNKSDWDLMPSTAPLQPCLGLATTGGCLSTSSTVLHYFKLCTTHHNLHAHFQHAVPLTTV
jgi:hypothetical protein